MSGTEILLFVALVITIARGSYAAFRREKKSRQAYKSLSEYGEQIREIQTDQINRQQSLIAEMQRRALVDEKLMDKRLEEIDALRKTVAKYRTLSVGSYEALHLLEPHVALWNKAEVDCFERLNLCLSALKKVGG
jgi:hypothetical protein